jgi:hypothetical protein
MPQPYDHDHTRPPDPTGDRSATGGGLTGSLHRSTGSFELALAPVLLALLGLWLDRTVGTVPVFTACCAVLGVAGSAVSVYYRYDRSMRRLSDGRAGVRR